MRTAHGFKIQQTCCPLTVNFSVFFKLFNSHLRLRFWRQTHTYVQFSTFSPRYEARVEGEGYPHESKKYFLPNFVLNSTCYVMLTVLKRRRKTHFIR